MYYADAILYYFTLHNLYMIFNIAPHIITHWILIRLDVVFEERGPSSLPDHYAINILAFMLL